MFEAVKAQAQALLRIGKTRLELLGNELEVARITALRQLMLAHALTLCAGLAVVFTVALLTLVFWEQRLLVLGLAGLVFWGLAIHFYLALRRGPHRAEPLFGSSLAELQEDLRQLKAATGYERPAD